MRIRPSPPVQEALPHAPSGGPSVFEKSASARSHPELASAGTVYDCSFRSNYGLKDAPVRGILPHIDLVKRTVVKPRLGDVCFNEMRGTAISSSDCSICCERGRKTICSVVYSSSRRTGQKTSSAPHVFGPAQTKTSWSAPKNNNGISCGYDSTLSPKARKQKMLHSLQQAASLTRQKPARKSNAAPHRTEISNDSTAFRKSRYYPVISTGATRSVAQRRNLSF